MAASEVAHAVVNTVQVEAGLVSGVGEDMLLEIFVAELGMLMGLKSLWVGDATYLACNAPILRI